MNFRGFWKWNNKLFQLNCTFFLIWSNFQSNECHQWDTQKKMWQTPINLIKSSGKIENAFETFQLTNFQNIFHKRKIHLISHSNCAMRLYAAHWKTSNKWKNFDFELFIFCVYPDKSGQNAISYTFNSVWWQVKCTFATRNTNTMGENVYCGHY